MAQDLALPLQQVYLPTQTTVSVDCSYTSPSPYQGHMDYKLRYGPHPIALPRSHMLTTMLEMLTPQSRPGFMLIMSDA